MKFTVFTPTYNRAHTLHRVYESLLEQTERDFEWLVIDDGSSDGTRELMLRFMQCQSLFPIRYLSLPENSGKHIAHNWATKEACGDLFLVADSDDWIVRNALERMGYHWSRLLSTSDYCGVCGLCADVNGNVIGTRYSKFETHSTLSERKFKYGMKGEHWGCMRTDIVRQYPFPEVEGFVPEGLVWLQIAKKYRDFCVNEVWRIYDNSNQTRRRPPKVEMPRSLAAP